MDGTNFQPNPNESPKQPLPSLSLPQVNPWYICRQQCSKAASITPKRNTTVRCFNYGPMFRYGAVVIPHPWKKISLSRPVIWSCVSSATVPCLFISFLFILGLFISKSIIPPRAVPTPALTDAAIAQISSVCLIALRSDRNASSRAHRGLSFVSLALWETDGWKS